MCRSISPGISVHAGGVDRPAHAGGDRLARDLADQAVVDEHRHAFGAVGVRAVEERAFLNNSGVIGRSRERA